MTGKKKCEFLKKLREEIAKENGIEGFEYKKCDFEGECEGTCPACDAELEALSNELKKLGKEVSKHDPGDVEKMRQKDLLAKACVLPGELKPLDGKMSYRGSNNDRGIERTLGQLRDPDDRKRQEHIVLGQMQVLKPQCSEQEINNHDYTDADFPDEFDAHDENIQKDVKGTFPSEEIELEGDLVDLRPMIGKVVDFNRNKKTVNEIDKKPRGLLDKKKDGDKE